MGELKQVIIGTLLVVGIGGIVIGGILNLEKAFIYIVGTVPIGLVVLWLLINEFRKSEETRGRERW